jgi:cytosine deaminase
MALDLVLRQARRAEDKEAVVDIAIAGGRIVEIAEQIIGDAPAEQLDGRLVIAGFVESHIHLDKSRILERCDCEHGTLEEAIASVAAAKRSFSEADIYDRGRHTLEKAIIHGTTRMRTHVEIDPRVGLKGFQQCASSSAITRGRSICKSAPFPKRASPTIPARRSCW